MTIKINHEWTLHLPEGYQKIPLPFFKEWIDALESGIYEQGKDCLVTNHNKYCCLGVLVKIQGRFGEFENKFNQYLLTDNPCFPILKGGGCIPANVFLNGNFNRTLNLAEANDEGLTFKEIATIIKHLWKQ